MIQKKHGTWQSRAHSKRSSKVFASSVYGGQKLQVMNQATLIRKFISSENTDIDNAIYTLEKISK